MIYLGADHRGFELKSKIFTRLLDEGYDVRDLGNDHLDPDDDYVDFAQKVAGAVAGGPENKGILFCGSGAGVDIVANKFDGIRSALVFDLQRAKQAREDDNANIISLPADILDIESAFEIVKIFLETSFSDKEKYQRRLEKLQEIEKTN
ncbi:MAG: RpiB/LacA/LacB family sugar-phosphate isomerase [Candidatus Daviesbacteria bacterium]|nr:RpiB/LacA/LacB family sugar-phosphate isomerase [Candidatus Daviesbacteria bacterium]